MACTCVFGYHPDASGKMCVPIISLPGLPVVASPCDIPQTTAGNAAQAAIPGLSGLIQAFQTLTSPSTWVHVGLFAVALVFLIIGMMVLVSGEK
jgi:hypothetical protein